LGGHGGEVGRRRDCRFRRSVFAFAGPIFRNAVRVPGLEREVSRFARSRTVALQQLASALNRAEANYQELRQMLGVKAPPVTRSAGAGAGGIVARNTDFATSMRAVPIRAGPAGCPYSI